jgi:hypothetical protein
MKTDNRRLPFAGNSFDFVFSGSFDRATVPALLASEIESTLKANGVAVILVYLRALSLYAAPMPHCSHMQ